jgi:antitoxin HicB
MNMDFLYPTRLTPDDGGFMVSFRDIPEATSFGETRAEALAMASDCLAEVLGARMHAGEDIPAPTKPRRGETLTPVPPLIAAKAGLYQALRDEGVSRAELARRLGVDFQQVRRMLNVAVSSRLDHLAAAYAVLGKRIEVAVRDAA